MRIWVMDSTNAVGPHTYVCGGGVPVMAAFSAAVSMRPVLVSVVLLSRQVDLDHCRVKGGQFVSVDDPDFLCRLEYRIVGCELVVLARHIDRRGAIPDPPPINKSGAGPVPK